MFPVQQQKTADAPTTEQPAIADILMTTVHAITQAMLTTPMIPQTADDAVELYAACILMDMVTGQLRDIAREALPGPGVYGDTIITTTPRQTRQLLAISTIRELAAEVDDDDALPPQPQEEEARICRYIVDHMQKDSNESKSENFHCDVYEVTA